MSVRIVRNPGYQLAALFLCVIVIGPGCSSEPQPSSQPAPPASQSASQPVGDAGLAENAPEPDAREILPESEQWDFEQALAQLTDVGGLSNADAEIQRVSAAVRLVRLADQQPACVPTSMPAHTDRQLAVMALTDALWVLGWRCASADRIAAPVLIDANGQVSRPCEPHEEETALLFRSSDVEFFPHLIVTSSRVLIVDQPIQTAMLLRKPRDLAFALRHDGGFAYVALLLHAVAGADCDAKDDPEDTDQPVEVARYIWDPYELAFTGPASDKLPDPAGGYFELDIDASKALVPVGGFIPEPEEFPEPGEQPKQDLKEIT